MLVVTYAIVEWCKKAEKWMEPWHAGIQLRVLKQWELSNEYRYDRDCMVFKHLCIPVIWKKVALASEGLLITLYMF